MRTRQVKKYIVVTTILLGLILSSFGSVSLKAMISDKEKNTQVTPQGDIIFTNSTEPIIDGNIESYEGEWENATVHTVNIGSGPTAKSITTRVQANSTHLFMGITYTTSTFVDFNLENHTWFAVVFDRNFDSRIGYSNDTIDDGVVINYRQLGSQDVYFNGTTHYCLVADDNVTGVENSIGVLDEYLDDFNRHVVTIEIAKELNSMDEAGNDIELYEGESIRYLLMLFQNHTAAYNYTLIDGKISAWRDFRLYPTYEYFSYEKDLSKKSVLTYISKSQNTVEQNLSVIYNLINSYGFNTTLEYQSASYDFTYEGIKSYDLIVLVGALKNLSEEDVEALRFYTSAGGKLLVLGEVSKDTDPINQLLNFFGLQIYNSTVFSEDLGVNSSITLDSNDIINLPYFNEASILSSQSVSSIFYQGSALNFTLNGTIGETYIQFQEGDLYATLNKTGEYYIDLDDDRIYNSTLDYGLNDSAVFQAAVELQRGGKLIATASPDIFNSTNILKEDNKYLLVKQLEWLLNFQYQLLYDNYFIESTSIDEGDAINVNITVYSDNATILTDLHVWVVVLELKVDQNRENLINTGDNTNYNGSIIPASSIKANYIDVTVRMHKRGYGYNATQLVEIFMEPVVGKPVSVDVISLIVFIISIGLAVIGGFATRRFKTKEESS